MSIISKIPDNSRAHYPVAVFTSDNLDINSDYNFGIAGNAGVTIFDNVQAGSIYLIERVAFFANVAESDWLSGMKTGVDLPRISLAFSRAGGASIFADPFRCCNYVNNNEQLIYFRSTQKNDTLLATMIGKVAQVAGEVGRLTLRAELNLTVYEVTDRRWITLFEQDPSHLGTTLRV